MNMTKNGRPRSRAERVMTPRIVEVLDAWDPNELIPIQKIADYLQERYPEYNRLKQGPFLRIVEDVLLKLKEIDPVLTAPVFPDDARIEAMRAEIKENEPEDIPDSNNLNGFLRTSYQDEEESRKKRKLKENSSKTSLAQKKPKQVDPSVEWAKTAVFSEPSATYEDIGGLEDCLQQIREIVEPSLLHPEIYTHLGVPVSQGILLHGPSGCGKTLLANALAGELGVKFLKVAAPEIVSGMSGESEAKLRALFNQAIASAPCLVFLDEVDAITPKRESAGREMERRIVAQLLTSMDTLAKSGAPVVVIGATNRPDALDPALRRAGRFDREISIGIPNEDARCSILKVLARKMKLDGEFDFELIASNTAGYVGSDLAALTKEAASVTVRRIYQNIREHDENAMDTIQDRSEASDALRQRVTTLTEEELEPLRITMGDFMKALTVVQPSSKREGFATVPDVTWNDVGALEALQEELNLSLVLPILHSKLYASIGLSCPAGVLLFGPPGNGKTLLAKAVANQSKASFISVKGPELLNKYVGESEKSVRQVFQRARASAPCVVFFDELDALCPRRGGSREGSGVSERVVNQLLTEMDGLDERRQVFIIAATNRPDIIDPAILRPGRLDKLLYVPLPDMKGREAILRKHVKNTPLHSSVDIGAISRDSRCAGFSGADMAALVREASLAAIRKTMTCSMTVNESNFQMQVGVEDFEEALGKVFPSVTESQRKRYDKMHSVLCCSRSIDSSSLPEE